MKKQIECKSEEGITIGIIDSIINSIHLLESRNIESEETKEAIKDLLSSKFLSNLLIKSYEFGEEFWKYPQRYVPISEVGHDRIKNLYGRFCVELLINNLSIFNKSYETMKSLNNFSKGNCFGEMSIDKNMWIEKHKDKKIIVLECKSYSFIYIKENSSFYIYSLSNSNDYPNYRKVQYKENKLENIRKYGFNKKSFSEYTHIFSCDFIFECNKDIQSNDSVINSLNEIRYLSVTPSADYRTFKAIEEISSWDYYINDLENLI